MTRPPGGIALRRQRRTQCCRRRGGFDSRSPPRASGLTARRWLTARLAEVLVPHSTHLDVLANPIDGIRLSVLRLAAPDPLSDKGPRAGTPRLTSSFDRALSVSASLRKARLVFFLRSTSTRAACAASRSPNTLSDCARISSSAAERSSVLRSPSVQATTSACRSSAAAAVQRAKAEGNDGGKLARVSRASAVWPVSRKQCERARNTDSSLNRTGTSIRSATSTRVTTLRR